MWYPPQQQQCWRGYAHHLSPLHRQQQQTYSGTLYYCGTDESPSTNQASTYVGPRNEENESFGQYQSTCVDDVYVTGTDYYVTNSTGSYGDEMSSSALPHQNSTTHWNPVIVAPPKPPTRMTNTTSSPSSSSSACWDWLLYPPEIYSHLYVPSSSSFFQPQQQDDDSDLLASLPSWLLVLLKPSMNSVHTTDDENESDQEISSLHSHPRDEPLLSMNIEKKFNHVSSNSFSSSEKPKTQENRSSTPDTDDGYQSASDASRSDYSQQSLVQYDHHSKDAITINVPSPLMPKRISYAAAVKPIAAPITKTIANHKMSPLASASIKMKNNSSSTPTTDTLNPTGQKFKFTAPRFERMHHAKQYSSSTTTLQDSSSILPLTSFTNRGQMRSNNNQHNHIAHSTRRR